MFAQIEGNNAQLGMSRQHQKAGVTGIEADLDHNTLVDAGSASAFKKAMLVAKCFNKPSQNFKTKLVFLHDFTCLFLHVFTTFTLDIPSQKPIQRRD